MSFNADHHNGQIEVGHLIEVANGHWQHIGKIGIVQEVNGNTLTLREVDGNDEWLTPHGKAFTVNIGSVTRLPTPTEIRRQKTRFRAEHLANLRPPNTLPPPGIREIDVPQMRRKPLW